MIDPVELPDTQPLEDDVELPSSADTDPNLQAVPSAAVIPADHMTPLHHAAHQGDIQRLKQLLEQGTDINEINPITYETALDYAVRGPFEKKAPVLHFLLARNASLRNQAGVAAFDTLCQQDLTDCTKATLHDVHQCIDMFFYAGAYVNLTAENVPEILQQRLRFNQTYFSFLKEQGELFALCYKQFDLNFREDMSYSFYKAPFGFDIEGHSYLDEASRGDSAAIEKILSTTYIAKSVFPKRHALDDWLIDLSQAMRMENTVPLDKYLPLKPFVLNRMANQIRLAIHRYCMKMDISETSVRARPFFKKRCSTASSQELLDLAQSSGLSSPQRRRVH